jgi:hypothetical protein
MKAMKCVTTMSKRERIIQEEPLADRRLLGENVLREKVSDCRPLVNARGSITTFYNQKCLLTDSPAE